ncbi:STAS domain-containing protein [Motilibacter aurantiacus]|uniref:STAS domain-containing protein n=1 Tax=Motilibacter aurantiacus TaxID=2714955 RepID=UPI001407BB37|nr:STAS domain-containing protein [Motilibacter aurantiacus]NHC46550.1 STAS domain-containing protein [Motilibacter aurantiacus]
MELRVQHEPGGRTVVAPVGDVDLASAPELRVELLGLIGDGCSDILVDLADVPFVDSTALGVLVAARHRVTESGGRLVLGNANPELVRLFHISGMDRVFELVD